MYFKRLHVLFEGFLQTHLSSGGALKLSLMYRERGFGMGAGVGEELIWRRHGIIVSSFTEEKEKEAHFDGLQTQAGSLSYLQPRSGTLEQTPERPAGCAPVCLITGLTVYLSDCTRLCTF